MTLAKAERGAFLAVAIRAAQAAAQIHQRYAGSDLGIKTKSSEIDLVTRADKESESRIRELLLGAYPEHGVLGEEEGQKGSAPYRWIVDPLDGTLNYAHGFPFYGVSVALEIRGQLEVGVVLDSARNELFTATRGGGAFLNGAPIAVKNETELIRAMIATGFSYDRRRAAQNVAIFAKMMPKCRALRRPGAAALDLAYVACGRFDGFWELALNPWDVAAGVLLVEEAGGVVTGPTGHPYTLADEALVTANAALQPKLLEALELPEAQR